MNRLHHAVNMRRFLLHAAHSLKRYTAPVLLFAALQIHAESPASSAAPPAVIFELLALNHDFPTPQFPRYRSPAAIVASPDKRYLYIAEQTAKNIAVVDIASRRVIRTIRLPNEVTGITVAPGGRLYAACSSDLWPNGMVCEVDAKRGKVLRRLPAGSGARSPVVNRDGTTLYVCNQYDDEVECIDIGAGTVIEHLRTFHQPFAASLTPDGTVMVVIDCVPYGKSTDTRNIAAKVSIVSTATYRVDTTISLPTGSHSVFGVTVSPEGAFAFVTHLAAVFTLRASAIEGGWIHTNNLAVIDIKNRRLLNDFPLDDPHKGAANPWGVACTDDGSATCVAHAGSNELTVIDTRKMLAVAAARCDAVTTEREITFLGCSHDLTALSAIKERISIAGKGPRALAIVGNRVFTAGYFGDSTGRDNIEIFDIALGKNTTKSAGNISLGPPQPLGSARKGELAFYDGTLCRQQWQSCSSCHPSARADGLNWTLGSNPANTPKNVKSMVYSWWTPPTQWTGKRAGAAESVRLGFVNSLFTTTDYGISADIDTVLMRIKPVPSPHLVKGRLSAAAARGKTVYFQSPKCDCITCHCGPLYTDRQLHRTFLPNRWDLSSTWDAPSVVETWRDPPYGHLGSFDRIEDMLRYEGHSACMINGLPEKDFCDLVQFVLSL